MHNNYEEVSTQVEVGMTTLDVTVGMYVQDMQSSSVMAFNRQLNLAHLLSFVVSLIIAVVAAIIISKHISRPILILNKNLKHISKANYETYEEIDSNIYEIEQLNSSSKKIRDSLKEQDEIRGRLIANLSHDLRTPLTVIKTKLEAMSDGVIEVNKENLDVASERLDRIISIVGQLDQLTTIPGTDVNKVESNISKETKSTVKLFEAEARELGLTVESEIENDIILNVNVDYYNQILQNLIANAIKYNNPNGKVIVTLFKEKEVIHLVVKDTGIGIKQEEVPYIFERFYRCDKSRHAQNSSGIGLSIVKTLVNIIGGDVEVTSTYGKGTTFEIKFDEKNKEKLWRNIWKLL